MYRPKCTMLPNLDGKNNGNLVWIGIPHSCKKISRRSVEGYSIRSTMGKTNERKGDVIHYSILTVYKRERGWMGKICTRDPCGPLEGSRGSEEDVQKKWPLPSDDGKHAVWRWN